MKNQKLPTIHPSRMSHLCRMRWNKWWKKNSYWNNFSKATDHDPNEHHIHLNIFRKLPPDLTACKNTPNFTFSRYWEPCHFNAWPNFEDDLNWNRNNGRCSPYKLSILNINCLCPSLAKFISLRILFGISNVIWWKWWIWCVWTFDYTVFKHLHTWTDYWSIAVSFTLYFALDTISVLSFAKCLSSCERKKRKKNL